MPMTAKLKKQLTQDGWEEMPSGLFINPGLAGLCHEHNVELDEMTPYIIGTLRQIANGAVAYESGILKALAQFVEPEPIDPGTEVFVVPFYRLLGATTSVGPGTTPTGAAEVEAGEVTIRQSETEGIHWKMSIQEQWAEALARRNGNPISRRTYVEQAGRRAVDEFHDRTAAIGNAAKGTYGLLNNPYVRVRNMATSWLDLEPAEIFSAIADAWNDFKKNARGLFTPNTLLVPMDVHTRIITQPINSTQPAVTVGTEIRDKLGITLATDWDRCEGAGAGGVDRGLLYVRNNREIVSYIVSQLFFQGAPEQRGFDTIVHCLGRAAGCLWRRPFGGMYLDGVSGT